MSVPAGVAGTDEPSVIEVDGENDGYDVRFGGGITAGRVRTGTEV